MTRHSHRLTTGAKGCSSIRPQKARSGLTTLDLYVPEAERIAARLLEGRIVAGRHREPKPITIRKFSWEDDNE